MGSTAWAINEATEYMRNSKGEWISQNTPSNSNTNTPEQDMSNYVTVDMLNEVAATIPNIDPARVQAAINYLDEKTHDIKFIIGDVPKGTMIDYRNKEIRIYVSDTSKLIQQNVGPTGDATKYYIPFYAFAPEGAVSFKEGLQGAVDDEIFTFDNDFAGIDSYGRKYSIVWLAIASYNEAYDIWTYYGANSKSGDMIGWTYAVEWYDADNTLIEMNSIRINLSNKDCHLDLADCYN